MRAYILLVWLVSGGFGGDAPARVDEYGTRAACEKAGEAWKSAGSRVGLPGIEEHREAARWVCLPGEK